MATLRYLINDAVELLEQYSDDSNFSSEHIAYNFIIARAMLIQQRYSSRANVVPQKIKQQFNHTLELAEENEFSSGLGTVLRTVNPIQTPLESFNLKSNMKISTGSYLDPYFSLIEQNRFPFVGRNKWNQNQVYVTLGNDFRLYFTSNNPKVKAIDSVRLSYVTDNPEISYPSSVSYDASVEYWDQEFHMEQNLITQLTDIVIKKLGIKLEIPSTETNNSNDDS